MKEPDNESIELIEKDKKTAKKEPKPKLTIRSVFKFLKVEIYEILKEIFTRDVFVTMNLYMLCVFISKTHAEIFSIWAILNYDEGGLDFDNFDIGIVMAIQSIVYVIFQIFIATKITKVFGKLWTLRIGLLVYIPLIFIPQLNLIQDKATLWILIVIQSIIYSVSYSLNVLSILVLNNNGPRPEKRGVIIGISNSLGCIPKSFGPII